MKDEGIGLGLEKVNSRVRYCDEEGKDNWLKAILDKIRERKVERYEN